MCWELIGGKEGGGGGGLIKRGRQESYYLTPAIWTKQTRHAGGGHASSYVDL
jgi:hypothetical protein